MVYMAYRRRNREVIARTYRIYKGLSDGLDAYAEKQDLSSNAALNRLLKIALEIVGINCEDLQNESSSESLTKKKRSSQTRSPSGGRGRAMTNLPNLPSDNETIHSATDSDKCYEMKRRYGWDLLRIDEHPEQPIFKVDCVFVGEAKFPNYMEDDNND